MHEVTEMIERNRLQIDRAKERLAIAKPCLI